MDKESSMLYDDRMKLIVATMTKDYDKAIDIGKSILRSEPDDVTVQKYLAALKNQADKIELIRCDSDANDSDSELSDDSNTDDSSSDSKSESGCHEIEDNKNGQIHGVIEPKEFSREFSVKKRAPDYDRKNAKMSRDSKHKDQGSRNDKSIPNSEFFNEFGGKMIRVLPIRLRRINK